MNAHDYILFGHWFVDIFIGLIGLALCGGLAWMIHEAITDPHGFFGC